MQKKESEFAGLLAKERKEASKINLKNVQLEEDLRQLEAEREHWVQDKENFMKTVSEKDLIKAFNDGFANGLAAGSLFVYQGTKKGVLISYPEKGTILF